MTDTNENIVGKTVLPNDTVEIPLEKRVCHTLMTAGILGSDGCHPLCLGKTCSEWEACLFGLLKFSKDIKTLVSGRDVAHHKSQRICNGCHAKKSCKNVMKAFGEFTTTPDVARNVNELITSCGKDMKCLNVCDGETK